MCQGIRLPCFEFEDPRRWRKIPGSLLFNENNGKVIRLSHGQFDGLWLMILSPSCNYPSAQLPPHVFETKILTMSLKIKVDETTRLDWWTGKSSGMLDYWNPLQHFVSEAWLIQQKIFEHILFQSSLRGTLKTILGRGIDFSITSIIEVIGCWPTTGIQSDIRLVTLRALPTTTPTTLPSR